MIADGPEELYKRKVHYNLKSCKRPLLQWLFLCSESRDFVSEIGMVERKVERNGRSW